MEQVKEVQVAYSGEWRVKSHGCRKYSSHVTHLRGRHGASGAGQEGNGTHFRGKVGGARRAGRLTRDSDLWEFHR